MAPVYSTSYSSKGGSSSGSTHSHDSRHTQGTNITSYSTHRPVIKHHDTCPISFGKLVDEPMRYDEDHCEDPRASVETYASTVPSAEDLVDTIGYELPAKRHICFTADAIPSTPPDFAELYPSRRRILIQHDDSTSDGNMNIRCDTEVKTTKGGRTKMTLFHLRMKDLHERQFSLRRYCRDSGREVCNSKKKYVKPISKSSRAKRPALQRSLSSALHTFNLKKLKNLQRQDSGYESDSDLDIEEELKTFAINAEVKATIPTNIIRLEFSNYAQVEVHRCRNGHEKMYDFEYWGEPYVWRRIFSVEDDEPLFSYELYNVKTNDCIAYIMPDKISAQQARHEERSGGWVPPSSMRITGRDISDDLGDVVIATGLIALTDDCIKRRWHSTRTARISIPTEDDPEYVQPDQLVDEIFNRPGYTTSQR